MIRRFMVALAVSLFAVAGLAVPAAAGAPVYTPAGGVVADDFSTKAGKLKAGEKFLAPRVKGASGAAGAARLTTTYYQYNLGQQFNNSLPSGVPQGVALNMTIHARTVDTADGGIHSISQIAWREVTGPNPATDEQIVEFGYESNPGVFGDSLPRVMGSVWVNSTWCGSHTGAGSCGVSWVDNGSNSINLGGSINGAVGNSRTFEISYDPAISNGGGFRLYYNGSEVGYFKKNVGTPNAWPSNFDQLRTFQVYGEVATTQDPMTTDCTGMGDDANLGDASPAAGAQVGSVTYKTAALASTLPTSEVNVAVSETTNPGTYNTGYNIESQSTRTFRYGGPGAC